MSVRRARCAQRLVTISSQSRRERPLEFATRFSREPVHCDLVLCFRPSGMNLFTT